MIVEQDELAWSEKTLDCLYGHRDRAIEIIKCHRSPVYFVHEYVWIYNATVRSWVKMRLWPAQAEVLRALDAEQYLIVLKARQLGMSWLALGYALWLMLFRPAASILFMSKREDEAVELLANRLVPMHRHLPQWMQAEKVQRQATRELFLSNGSQARAFSTGGGRSYTASMAILDEADFVQDLNGVMNALKPTVDAGGKLVLISTVDKTKPVSTFKQIFRAAQRGENTYKSLFLPWSARPSRTEAWYAQVARDMYAQEGSNDSLWQEYPATVEEALAPKQLDKRFSAAWIAACEDFVTPVTGLKGSPALPQLRIYVPPRPGGRYVIGADPAEGNPRSDDSVATVLDAETWEEVACLAGKIEPDTLAQGLKQISAYYNRAGVMVERNNHGHAVLLALRKLGGVRIMEGHDAVRRAPGAAPAPPASQKGGWLQNEKGKALMYDLLAEVLRDGGTLIRTRETAQQLATIEASTLAAPEGLMDDFATSFALAMSAARLARSAGEASTVIAPSDVLEEMDKTAW